MAKVKDSDSAVEKKEDRGGWGSHIEFLLSCIGYSVGLGNVWRFPYLAFKNGGGAFIIPYVISVVVSGLPLYFMELSLGQFTGLGPNGVFKNLAPVFQGLGWGMVVVSLLVSLYYNMIIAWVLFYLFYSFRSELLWSHCRNDYNTNACHSNLEEKRCRLILNDTDAMFYNKTCYNSTMVQEFQLNDTVTNLTKVSPTEEFFEIFMLRRSPSFDEMGSISWPLVLCLAGAWLIVFACLIKGVKSSGKVVYFTATFPYLVLLILLIWGATLPGAADGLWFYMYPDWSKILNLQIWKDAAEQVFFSLGPAFGGLITMASYNKFNTNCKRDAIIIACVDSFTSTFAGCAIFAATGFMARELGVPIEKATKSGMSLAFVAYPEAIIRMPVPPVWSILFFFMLVNLGLDSEFAVLETVTTALMDTFPNLRRFKTLMIGAVCIVMFLLGLPFCTQGGIYIFQILNDYSAGYCVMLLALIECIVVSYVYGIRRFLQDVSMMLGSPPRYYWMATLALLTPAYLAFAFVASVENTYRNPSSYGDYKLPPNAQAMGISISLISILCVIGFAVYHLVRRLLTEKPLISLIRPTIDWCPASERATRKHSADGINVWSVTKF